MFVVLRCSLGRGRPGVETLLDEREVSTMVITPFFEIE
jgi:hypothetical protein